MTPKVKRLLQVVSMVGLVLSIVPALLFFQGTISKTVYLNLMLIGMVTWFGTAIFWIKPEHLGE
jgi:hypothetical protein